MKILGQKPLPAKAYRVVDGTSYDIRTPDIVIAILERSRREKLRIFITYGDPDTGKVWALAPPDRGYIGRSTGDIRIPLLVRTRRSLGGEAVLDYCIVKITESKGGKVLYNYESNKIPKPAPFDDITEADECATSKEAALQNLASQVNKNETHGIIAMYERAAWNAGASVKETEDVIARRK